MAALFFVSGCPSKQEQELPHEESPEREEKLATEAPTQSAHFSEPEEKRKAKAVGSVHPRDLFDWGKVTHEPYGERPKFTRSMQNRTKALHGFVVDEVHGSHRALALLRLVSLREISHHGSQRPFDGHGIVHRLEADHEKLAGILAQNGQEVRRGESSVRR